jgi:hypothetical protein
MKKKIKNFRLGQVTLEATLSFMVSLILLVGIVRTGAWFVRTLVNRQNAFDSTRIGVGGGPPDVDFYLINETNRLKVFD